MDDIRPELSRCTLCATRFAQTATAHQPRPVIWFNSSARILVAGQAPGMRVHASGKPFTDPSGDRLRSWMGLCEQAFYDRTRVAIVPMAFCFPGYNAKGHDLAPPAVCARTWHDRVMQMLPNIRLTVVIGGYAIKYHLGSRLGVTQAVKTLQKPASGIYVLPHPSWRNTGWLKKNPWFSKEVLPQLKAATRTVLND